MGRETVTGTDRLKDALKRYAGSRHYDIEQRPGCVYGLLTRDSVDDLRKELTRLSDAMTVNNRLLIALLVSIVLAAIAALLRAWGP